MDATVLKISNATNTLFDNYQIGNILNKNLLIRNIALMRNIGKYSMYNMLMFPEIGMTYNVYEHALNRPGDIGAINGVIGYNNAIDDDSVLSNNGDSVSDRFFSKPYTAKSDDYLKKKKSGQEKSNDKKSESTKNNTKNTLRKTVYSTNSGSVLRSGGDVALGEVMDVVNKIFVSENQYIPDDADIIGDGMSVERPKLLRVYKHTWGHARINKVRDTDDRFVTTYSEGKSFSESAVNEKNIPDHLTVNFMSEPGDLEDYWAINNKPGKLLEKTNQLFKEGKIDSLIARFYATEISDDKETSGDKIYLSRGRNLHKAGNSGVNNGTGYDNPYCRVWTIHNQYSKMTDLIRPRIDDETGGFASIQRIQAPYGYGLRPANGASRLSDMSVLKPNGFVNMAPHKDVNGNLDIESIKKCMFSIENLAWKDVKITSSTTRNSGKEEKLVAGGTLSAEQIGPNGGRIMWFPPYNLKFSEDVTTRWNANTFIGRGEDIYSYINTERGGTLTFTLLIDHPSVINKWKGANPDVNDNENEEKILRFFAGCDELGEETASQMQTLGSTKKTQKDGMNVNPAETAEPRQVKVFVFFPNNYSGNDDSTDEFTNYLHNANSGQGKSNVAYEMTNTASKLDTEIDGPGQKWWYKVDDDLVPEKLVRFESNNQYYIRRASGAVVQQTDGSIGNNHDTRSFSLNALNDSVLSSNDVEKKMQGAGFITTEDKYGSTFFSFSDLYDILNEGKTHTTSNGKDVWNPLSILLKTKELENVTEIELKGYASSHGHQDNNKSLCRRRADSVCKWILSKLPSIDTTKTKVEVTTKKVVNLDTTNHDVSSLDAKLARSVEVIFYVGQKKKNVVEKAITDVLNNRQVESKNIQESQLDSLKASRRALYQTVITKEREREIFDNEYTYFKELYESDSFIKSRIIEKINYFNPAYHSITPEGFNSRLTFLHQCTRQGPTVSASDSNSTKSTGVGNLAFGRAPYCILRIGDFYNTKILIDSMSINYDVGGGVQWDLNPEGVGVQPMMAEVNIRFKFIGGTDISGPIERLQNAVSFNYYSNASIYDRRADYREAFIDHKDGLSGSGGNPVFHWDAKTQGRKTDKKE